MSFVYILAAILIFGVLIAVHELGHFLAAKLCGVQVNEFSIGMGPAVWHRKKGETAYSFRILPIGGYCAMEGEDGDTGNARAFTRQGFWKKFVILAAGAFMNFLTGLLIVAILPLKPDKPCCMLRISAAGVFTYSPTVFWYNSSVFRSSQGSHS